MKLNPDCVRDILLTAEGACTYDQRWVYDCEDHDEPFPLLEKYAADEILYHIRQCDEFDFFLDCSSIGYGRYCITDLSPAGHEFLANIRTNRIFEGVKVIAAELGVQSLSGIMQIASNVALLAIKNHFGF